MPSPAVLLTGLLTAICLWACFTCARLTIINRKARVSRRFETLEQQLADLEERHASLHTSHKKLNSRIAMREARAKRHPEESPAQGDAETPQQWKDRMRRNLATGAIKHG